MYIHSDHKEIFNIKKEILDTYDKDLFDFLVEWRSNKKEIIAFTSGSTGKPKKIRLSKKAIINSAKTTNEYFKLNASSNYLICLPVKYIAGKMMLIRAIIAGAKITLTQSCADPIKNLTQKISFCAMTPYQLTNCIQYSKKQLNYIEKLIIGGGPVSTSLNKKLKNITTHCYHTFGMTETISHIAIRNMNHHHNLEYFKCLPHVKISTNSIGQLTIKSPLLNIKSLTTNDLILITENQYFKWVGRKDNVINSGGIKIYPELIEKKLESYLDPNTFFIDKIEDPILNQQVIIIINSMIKLNKLNVAFQCLEKYEIPKSIYVSNKFIYTNNNKLDRIRTKSNSIKINNLKTLDQ